MRTRWLPIPFLAAGWVAACGSSSTPDDSADAGAFDASSSADSDVSLLDASAMDASSISDASETLADGASDAACTPETTCAFSLTQMGTPVVATYEAATAPALMGGTIHDGTYALTQQTIYEHADGGPPQTTTQTIRWSCGSAVSVGSSNGYPEARSFTVVTKLTATQITEQVTTCVSGDAGDATAPISFIEAPYEATSTTLKFYVAGSKVLLTYTKI